METKDLKIAVIGCACSGKSIYISSLFQKMKDYLWDKTKYAFLPTPPDVWNMYKEGYPNWTLCKTHCSKTVHTPMCIVDKNIPKVIDLRFFDFTQEDLEGFNEEPNYLIEKVEQIPLNSYGGSVDLRNETPNAVIILLDYEDSVRENAKDNLCNFIHVLKYLKKDIKNIPIAVVINKLMKIKTEELDFSTEAFIEKKDIIATIKDNFNNYKFFTSSSGEMLENDNLKNVYEFKPDFSDCSCLYPFLWILNFVEKIKNKEK